MGALQKTGLHAAALPAVLMLFGVTDARATTDTAFAVPLTTVTNMVGGTGEQLAVGAALVGSGLRFNATQIMGAVGNGQTVTFRLEGGRVLELKNADLQLLHIDRAWASTVHAFQGRTVDTVIAAMEANHPHLTTQKTLHVEISRAHHQAELVTDNRDRLRERLKCATRERIAALESVEPGAK